MLCKIHSISPQSSFHILLLAIPPNSEFQKHRYSFLKTFTLHTDYGVFQPCTLLARIRTVSKYLTAIPDNLIISFHKHSCVLFLICVDGFITFIVLDIFNHLTNLKVLWVKTDIHIPFLSISVHCKLHKDGSINTGSIINF